MRESFKNVVGGICLLSLAVTFILLVGTAGAIECDSITISTGVKRGIVLIVLLIASVIGIVKTEKEDDEYDRL
jgi:hypothetical protein